MDYWCLNCPLSTDGKDLGFWSDRSDSFNQISQMHKDHSGFGTIPPEKTLQDKINEQTKEMVEEFAADFELTKQLREKDILKELVSYFEKEVKKETNNIYRVLLNGISTFSKNPNNSRILAPSSEGKTYLSSKISAVFPQENVVKIASASAQSFKYQISGCVRITKDGKLDSIDEELNRLYMAEAEATSGKERSEIKQQIRVLRDESFGVVDFENKWIIFSDSQNQALWESLKTLLSHDAEYIKHQVTNKINGQNTQQKIIFKGHPAMLYCSAKDEEKADQTREIESRFDTISLHTNPIKYKEGIKLISKRHGLPGQIFQEEIVSEHDTNLARKSVEILINNVKEFGNENNPILNPFATRLAEIFPHDTAIRQRQFDRFMQVITIITLCYAHKRCKIQYHKKIHPVTALSDILLANKIMKEPTNIRIDKIQFFNDTFKKALQHYRAKRRKRDKEQAVIDMTEEPLSDTWITALETAMFAQTKIKDRKMDRQNVQETYLRPLIDHGYVEERFDPDNKSRNQYTISHQYVKKEADLEATLIDTSLLDESCVRVFIEKQLKQRFDSGKLGIVDERDESITLAGLTRIVTQTSDFMPKNDSNEVSNSVDKKER